MKNKKGLISVLAIYLHVFFMGAGTNTLTYVYSKITLLDILLVIYFFLNFNSIKKSIFISKNFLMILLLFILVSVYSTIFNISFGNTQISETLSFLRYISYMMIIITYVDYLYITNSFANLFITFLLGILLVISFDIYFIQYIGEYNFFENYGRYIFGFKYFTDTYCFNSYFCYTGINVNTLSVLLSISLSLIIICLIDSNKINISIKQRIIVLILFSIFLFVAGGFGQKTAYFPFIFSIAIMPFILAYNFSLKNIKYYLLFSLLIIIFSIIYIDLINFFVGVLIDRTLRLDSQDVSSFYSRYELIIKAINLVDVYSFLIGLGKNSYFYLTGINDPHNINVQLFLETGIFGTLLYLMMLIYIAYRSYQYSFFLLLLFIINYAILSNANGIAFQSHASFMVFAFIIYLGQKKV